MRLAALLVMTLALALAAPAAAQQKGRLGEVAPSATGLRGPVPAGRAASAGAVAGLPPSTPASAVPASPFEPAGADQCRLSCARSYYFCLSGDTPEQCPQAWGQCRAACAPDASAGAFEG